MEARLIWLAIIVIAGMLVAILAGFLAWLAGKPSPEAVLVGGASFAGAVGLFLATGSFFQ